MSSRYPAIYWTGRLFGAGRIVKRYLGLPAEHALALTIPHGVDTYLNRWDLDLHTYEPLYLATRPDIAERVSRFKQPLLFPHPWYLMDEAAPAAAPSGTLFIATPPSAEGFARLYAAILAGDHERPWGILLKDRGLTSGDARWWQERGFATHSAGSIDDQQFYYNLRDIMLGYSRVASANMSSAVVFAAALGRRAIPIADVSMDLVEVPYVSEFQDFKDEQGLVRRTWSNLFSSDVTVAQAQARELLGFRYLASAEDLRDKYLDAVGSLKRKVHLHPLRQGVLQQLAEAVIEAGIPLERLFPSPLAKVRTRVARVFGRDRIAIVRGSDLSHYGIAGSLGRLRIEVVRRSRVGGAALPGHAVAMPEPSAEPRPANASARP